MPLATLGEYKKPAALRGHRGILESAGAFMVFQRPAKAPVLTFLSTCRYRHELFEQGRVYVAVPPLYRCVSQCYNVNKFVLVVTIPHASLPRPTISQSFVLHHLHSLLPSCLSSLFVVGWK